MLYSALLLLLGVASHAVTACSCAPRTLCEQLDDKSAVHVVNATAVYAGKTGKGESYMIIRAQRNIKGKLRLKYRYRVKTGDDLLCQTAPIPLRTPSIITLFKNPGSATIPFSGSLCSFNKPASDLTIEEGTILFNYPALCRNICPPGVPTLTCKLDPCAKATCPFYPNAKCRPDFCGACRARFYTGRKEVTSSCEPIAIADPALVTL